jgi:chromosome partitioning protein
MRKIAVLNQKGGVGKTTSAVNLAAAFAASGRETILLDLDPQAHASTHLGFETAGDGPTMYDVLVRNLPLADVRRTVSDRLHLCPSDINLAAAEVELAGVVGREVILREALACSPSIQGSGWGLDEENGLANGRCKPAGESFALTGRLTPAVRQNGETDFLLMDCAPSLGVLTLNALAAADEVFIPLQPHFLALHGLGKLLETTSLVSRRINPSLKVTGIIVCMYDANTKLASEVVNDLRMFLEKSRGTNVPWADARVFDTKIRRNVKLAEAPSHGQSIFDYAPNSAGATDYAALANEVMGGMAFENDVVDASAAGLFEQTVPTTLASLHAG